MTPRSLISLQRMLDVREIQERAAEVALMRSAQSVSSLERRLMHLESLQKDPSEEMLREVDSEVSESLLSYSMLVLMRERLTQAFHTAQQERKECLLELADRRARAEHLRVLLARSRAEIDRVTQRRDQQNLDDLYAAHAFRRSKANLRIL